MALKRLRGSALQKAFQEESAQPTPSESSKGHSSLVTKLLSLWAHGTLSAVMIRELAHLAYLDGANHPDIIALSKAGNFGEIPGNVHRDLMTTFAKGSDIKHFEIQVICEDPKTHEKVETDAAMFLPHRIFSNLAKGYPEKFDSMFNTSSLEAFWEGAERLQDDRLIGHPMTLKKDWKQKTIPIFVHGDGVEFQERDSLMVWCGGAVGGLFSSLDSHLLIASFPKSCTTDATWKPIMAQMCWSLKALMEGVHPCVDALGKEISSTSSFFLDKGHPLTPFGWRCVVWSIQGDHEFFSNVLGLPHWRNRYPCWECDASSDALPADKCVKTIQPGDTNFTLVTTHSAITHPKSRHPLFSIPGLTTRIVRGDGLHIMFTKRVYAHLLGSILAFMCWIDGPGAHQTVQPCKRLAVLFEQIQKHYKEKLVENRLTNLKLSMFIKVKSPHSEHAFLSAKGAECKHLAPDLLEVCQNVLNFEEAVHRDIIQALEGIVSLVEVFDKGGIYLSSDEHLLALRKAEQFLAHYDSLNKWAQENDRMLFHIVMKHHTFVHLVQSSKYLNPKFHWCFRNEDFVGKISNIAHSVSMGTRSTRLSLKVSPKYALVLHLRLTRDAFDINLSAEE